METWIINEHFYEDIPISGLGNLFHHRDLRLRNYVQKILQAYFKLVKAVNLQNVSFMCYVLFDDVQVPAPLWSSISLPLITNQSGHNSLTIRIVAQAPTSSISSSPLLNFAKSRIAELQGGQGSADSESNTSTEEFVTIEEIEEAKELFFLPTKCTIYDQVNKELFVSPRANIGLMLLEIATELGKLEGNVHRRRDQAKVDLWKIRDISQLMNIVLKNSLNGDDFDKITDGNKCLKCGLLDHKAFGWDSEKCPLKQEPLRELCLICAQGGHSIKHCPLVQEDIYDANGYESGSEAELNFPEAEVEKLQFE